MKECLPSNTNNGNTTTGNKDMLVNTSFVFVCSSFVILEI